MPRGRVSAISSVEPFPTVAEARQLWREARRAFRPYDGPTGHKGRSPPRGAVSAPPCEKGRDDATRGLCGNLPVASGDRLEPGTSPGHLAPCRGPSAQQLPPRQRPDPGASRTGGAICAVPSVTPFAQFIRICRWLQLIRQVRLVPLENAPFSMPWVRKRYRVAPRFRQY